MRIPLIVILILSIFFNQGCCSLFCSGSEVVSVNSKPEGASVKIGPHKGVTPYKVTLPRGKDYIIEVKYGDKTETVNLNRQIEGLYWVNILVWPGLIIDMATGKMYTYDPAEYEFNFQTQKTESAKKNNPVEVSQLKSCTNCSRKIGKLEKQNLYEGHVVCGECYKKLTEIKQSQ